MMKKKKNTDRVRNNSCFLYAQHMSKSPDGEALLQEVELLNQQLQRDRVSVVQKHADTPRDAPIGDGTRNPVYEPPPPKPPPPPPSPPADLAKTPAAAPRPKPKLPSIAIPARPVAESRRGVVLRKAVLGTLAIIGWACLLLALKDQAASAWRSWTAPIPCNVRPPDGWPHDPLAEALEYPDAVCYQADRQRRLVRYQSVYPLLALPRQQTQSPCQNPPNLASTMQKLVEQGQFRVVIELAGSLRVDLALLRYSLQHHIWKQEDDYLCAQHLGIPLCYCVWKRRTGLHQYQWEDMLGLATMTCLSNRTMMVRSLGDTLCGQPRDVMSVMYRFKTACLQYLTPQNELMDQRFSKDAAAVAQEIFLLQRGMRNCSYDEVAHGSDGVLSSIWQQYHAEALL